MTYAGIFDMDGVLVDSAEAHYQSWKSLGEEVGTPFDRDFFFRTFGMHNNQIIPMWLGNDVSMDKVARLGLRKEELYRAVAPSVLQALPGVVELVRELAGAGFQLAVASSGPRDNVTLILRLLGLSDLFHKLASGDEVQHGKPHPEVFLNAIRGLGLAADRCVVVEDAPQGVQAARAAGTSVVAVTSTRSRAELAEADLVVDSLRDLSAASLRRLIDRSQQRPA